MSTATPTILEIPTILTVMHFFTVFVVLLNFFAIYVILFHTPEPMKSFSRFLLYHQVVTLLFDVTCCILVAPWLQLPLFATLPTGALKYLGISTSAIIVFTFLPIALLVTSIGELFFQRQQSILPHDSILKLEKRWQINTWHGFNLVWILISTGVPAAFIETAQCDREDLANKYPMLMRLIAEKAFYCVDESYIPRAMQLLSAVIVMILFILFFLIGSIILSLYSSNYMIRVSQKTKDMQKQMFVALVVQTALPLSLLLLPVTAEMFIRVNHRIDMLDWNPWMVFAFSMYGPVSTCLVLILYKPYFAFLKLLLNSIRIRDFSAFCKVIMAVKPTTTRLRRRSTKVSTSPYF